MEAKRRYINKLIETMHQYASRSPEARELITELEFVWEQVKSNVSSQGAGDGEQRLYGNATVASVMHATRPLSAESDSREEEEEDLEEDGETDVENAENRINNPEESQSTQDIDLVSN